MQAQEEAPALSIIIPLYNEAEAIEAVISKIRELRLPPYEILVIDDGSEDEGAELARRAGAHVISHPYNIGNGAAVKTGIRCARGKVLLFLDADGQHDPKDIPRLLVHISHYHMVVGARQSSSETLLHRRLANKIYNLLASFIAEFKIQDLTSGFRVMRRADAIRFCDMFPNKFSYPTTSTLAFIRSGRSVKYVPIRSLYRVGKSKIKLLHDGFEFLLIIIKIVMSFSPFRVFLPLSSFLFFLGLGRYAYTYWTIKQFTNMSHLLINSSVIIFVLGLIAEQIAGIRLEKGDKVFEVQAEEEYRIFEELASELLDVPETSSEITH